MNLRNGLSYLNSVHNSGCFLNYSQQFVVQEFLGKDKVEFWTWKERKNGTVFDTAFDHIVFPIQALQEASTYWYPSMPQRLLGLLYIGFIKGHQYTARIKPYAKSE